MAALRITQVRSSNGADPKQRAALRTLCLGRIGSAASAPTTRRSREYCAKSSIS